MSNSANQLGGKCPYMPYLGRGQMSGGGTCPTLHLVKSIKVCEYSGSRSFHDDLILQDQASGERSQDQWSSG